MLLPRRILCYNVKNVRIPTNVPSVSDGVFSQSIREYCAPKRKPVKGNKQELATTCVVHGIIRPISELQQLKKSTVDSFLQNYTVRSANLANIALYRCTSNFRCKSEAMEDAAAFKNKSDNGQFTAELDTAEPTVLCSQHNMKRWKRRMVYDTDNDKWICPAKEPCTCPSDSDIDKRLRRLERYRTDPAYARCFKHYAYHLKEYVVDGCCLPQYPCVSATRKVCSVHNKSRSVQKLYQTEDEEWKCRQGVECKSVDT